MQFSVTDSLEAAANILEQRLALELANNKVLWLISGGSNIKTTVLAMQQVPEEFSSNLTIMLLDERYGEPGQKDSNWAQLLNAGFESKKAMLLPILKEGQSFEQSADYYNALAEKAFLNNDVIVAQIGMGADGHIAGILPNSAATESINKLVTHYESEPYKRMTLTFEAIKQINVAYVFAFGDDKKPALLQLKDESLDPKVQPAQILKELNEVYIYNDQVEGSSQ
jgi:6-phosphogluconolactonase/glucosamine-6-phosphate isomerase/deaminase